MSETKVDLAEKPTLQAAWNFAACMLAHPTQEYQYTPTELPESFHDVAGQCYYKEWHSIPSGKTASRTDVLSNGGEIKVELQRGNIVFDLLLTYVSDDQPIVVALRCYHTTTSQPYIYLRFSFEPKTIANAVKVLDFQVPEIGLRGEVYVPFANGLKRWSFISQIELNENGLQMEAMFQLFQLAKKHEKKASGVLVSA